MNFMQNLNQFIKDSVIEPFLSTKRFSLEFTLIGRNDDYEPNWREHLESTITYNRALFTGSNIDFRVALVEWNPPAKKPKLAETLVAKFLYARILSSEIAVSFPGVLPATSAIRTASVP